MTVRPWPRFASRSPPNRAPPRRLVGPAPLVLRKIRFALLEKRPHAFHAILGFESHLLRAAFRAQLFLQRIVKRRSMQGANLPEYRTGPGGQPMRHGLRAREELARTEPPHRPAPNQAPSWHRFFPRASTKTGSGPRQCGAPGER